MTIAIIVVLVVVAVVLIGRFLWVPSRRKKCSRCGARSPLEAEVVSTAATSSTSADGDGGNRTRVRGRDAKASTGIAGALISSSGVRAGG